MKREDLTELSRSLEADLLKELYFDIGAPSFFEINEIVKASDFDFFGPLFTEMGRAAQKGQPIHQYFAENKIEASQLMSPDFSGRPAIESAKLLKQVSRALSARKVLSLSEARITHENVEDMIGATSMKLTGILSDGRKKDKTIQGWLKIYTEYQKRFSHLKDGEIIGISTGFEKIDRIIDGIRPPHLWIVGGYTSMGKTFFSLNLLLSVLMAGKRAVYYSLEMSEIDIISRLLGIITGENGIDILKGKVSDSEKIEAAKKFLDSTNLSIVTTRRSLDEIIHSMSEENMIEKVDVFMVDYIQQIYTKDSDSEYESMRESAMAFQSIAEKFNVPVIVLSQISNEAAKSPNSNVMGFKGAGTIASAADFAVELVSGEDNVDTFRQKLKIGEPLKITLLVKKNRHGRTGGIDLTFDGKTGRFEDADKSLDALVYEVNNMRLSPP